MWLIEPACNGFVLKAWECSPEGTLMYVTTKRLKKCKKMLKAWSKDHFGNIVHRIKRTKELSWKAKDFLARTGCWDEVERLKSELSILYDKEEKMWQQRSHIQWLKNGDYNTKFFHGIATQRKCSNFSKDLRDENGVW